MPTYEYECKKCGREFEQFQKISDPPLKRCPKCKGLVRRKIGSGAGLLFKGSGFYTTDYRSDGYKKAASSDKSPPPASKSETKAETKSEGKDKAKAKKSDS
ncbi:MAG: FmdB family zinc ribbon protein [bacterium]